MIKKYAAIILLSLLLIADLTYTFIQQTHVVLDGDMAMIAGPKTEYAEVLKDPFGFQVLFENKIYCAPNRYFAHISVYEYFAYVPKWFHGIADPVESLYLATALSKVLIEIFLVVLLALYITAGRLTLKNFLLAAVIVIPFFQTFGYYLTMGIIDLAPAFAFAYALPIALLMLFFLPFYKSLYNEEKLNLSWTSIILLGILAIVVALNGPIIPAISGITVPFVLFALWFSAFRLQSGSFAKRALAAFGAIPKALLFLFSWLIFLSLYSLYIGQNNAESVWGEVLPLLERYQRLPIGFYDIITTEPGIPIMLLVVYVNAGIIYTYQAEYRTKVLTALKWIGIFSLVYLLLLPFGGYRPYRPNIIKLDTFLPVTLSLVYFIGLSTFYLLTDSSFVLKKVYTGLVAIVLLWFTYVEKNDFLAGCYNNECQKAQLYKIYNSKDEIVEISSDCDVLYWGKQHDYLHTYAATDFLRKCGIVEGKKYYFQK